MNPFDRTHATNLTDDELLLFDFLFNKKGATLQHLSHRDFRFHMNWKHTHRLDDLELAQAMRDLVRRGLVATEWHEYFDTDGYLLTPAGGELWERERRPNWQRYCSNSYGPDDDDWEQTTGTLVVLCHDRQVGEAFWRAARECRLFDLLAEPTTTFLGPSRELVYWRTFDLWQISGAATDRREEDMFATDWKHYEQLRTWWRGLNELISTP